MSRMIYGIAQAMLDPDIDDPTIEDKLCALTQAAYDQSWQWTEKGAAFTGPEIPAARLIVFAMRYGLLQSRVGDAPDLDSVAREVGLSRPHFYKLFRAQVGLTPNLYLNALRMERAIDLLAESQRWRHRDWL
jgi:AraC-like DNA-binding protein